MATQQAGHRRGARVALAVRRACTAAFSLIDALILRTLPVDDPRSLIYVALRTPVETGGGLSFNYPLFREMRGASSAQVRLFALSDQAKRDAVFDDNGHAEKVYGQWVSGDAFAILGVQPALGRMLASTDDINPGQHPVAVLSYDFWTRRFDRNPDVLGRWVTIREKPLQIVGVAAKGFTGVEPGITTDIWAPTMMWDHRAISDPDTRWFRIWGRIQTGVAEVQARTVLQTVFGRFAREQAARRSEESRERLDQLLNTRVHLRSAATGPSGYGLMSFEVSQRLREMAIRLALGAERRDLLKHVIGDGAGITVVGLTVGALLALSSVGVLRSFIFGVTPYDATTLVAAVAILSAIATLACVLPALRASRADPTSILRTT